MAPWLTLSGLRSSGVVPHYFGLGFIQVKLNERERLHFWVPDWPTVEGAEHEFHDHRYGFTSRVLAGAVEHEVCVLGPLMAAPEVDSWEVVGVSCQPGVNADPHPQGFAPIIPVGRFCVGQGNTYSLQADTFHRSRALGPTITHLRRETPFKKEARVLRRIGQASSCPFSIPITTEQCWERISVMLIATPLDWPGRPLSDLDTLA